MQLKDVKQGLFCLEYFIGALIIITQAFQYTNLTSLLFYSTFVITMLLWVATSLDDVDRIDILALVIIVLTLLNVVANGISQNANFSFDYLKKFIMFSSTIIFFHLPGK